jgi:hypothetical protein
MITVYNMIYTKPEWCAETAFAHLLVCGSTPIGKEENDNAIVYTLIVKPDTDKKPSLFLPLSESVGAIIKDLNLPVPPEQEQEKKSEVDPEEKE